MPYGSLNNEPYIARPRLIDSSFIELYFYSFRISLDRCNGSFNTVDDLPANTCGAIETKDVNIKAFDITTRINKSKALLKIFHSILNANFKIKMKS